MNYDDAEEAPGCYPFTDEECERENAKCKWIGLFKTKNAYYLSPAANRAWKESWKSKAFQTRVVRPADALFAKHDQQALTSENILAGFTGAMDAAEKDMSEWHELEIIDIILKRPKAFDSFACRLAAATEKLDEAYRLALEAIAAEAARAALAAEKIAFQAKQDEARIIARREAIEGLIPRTHREPFNEQAAPHDFAIVKAFDLSKAGSLLIIGKAGSGKARAAHHHLFQSCMGGIIPPFLTLAASDVKTHLSPKSLGPAPSYAPSSGELETERVVFIRDIHLASLSPGYGRGLLTILGRRSDDGLCTIISTALGGDALILAWDKAGFNRDLANELFDTLAAWQCADFDE